jgi:hypothetical protein
MAFNPFEAFSIRSKLGKAVMAILGIVVMLTFVLSTGMTGQGNDFFDQVSRAIGGPGTGEVVAEAYGDDISEADLAEIGRQRRAANNFLAMAIESSYSAWARELDQELKGTRLEATTKSAISRFVALRTNPNTDPRAYQAFITNEQALQQISIARMLAKPDSEDKKALDAVTAILSYDFMRLRQALPPTVLPEVDQESDRGLLDFAILLKKADQLGIKLSPDGVRELVRRETGGRLSREENAAIERVLRRDSRFEGMTGEWLIDAIGNEYRARMAFDAMIGQSAANAIDRQMGRVDRGVATLGAMPGAVTPYEFWEFFKDRTSEHSYSTLEVNAESFVDQVKGQPTPRERVDLFNRHKGDVPDPARPTPGFKDPRKLKIEFTTLDATAPRVTQAIPKVQAASVVLSGLAGPMSVGGNGVTALFQAAHPGLSETLPIRETVSTRMQANLAPYRDIERWEFNPRDTSIYRPEPIVSALGVLAGGPDVATLTAATAAVHQQVHRIEMRTRIPILMQSVLTPFNPTLANAIGMPAFAYAHNPKMPPESLYMAAATEDARKQQRRNLFRADVRELEEKLRELTKDADPFALKVADKAKIEKAFADARKHLEEWLKARGLTPAGTPEPIDKFAVAGAPALKPLNDKAEPELDGTNSLADRLFRSFDGRFIGRSGQINSTQPFDPFWFPAEPAGMDSDKPTHFVWVSQDVETKVYNSLENADRLTNGEMTKRVDRAWRLERAKELAKAEADRLAEQVKGIAKAAPTNPSGVERQLKDLAAEKKLRLFEIERLAALRFQHEATQARMGGYEPPQVERKLVLYPTPDFADKLLALRKEPLGAVTVLNDAPKVRYYVAAATGRTEKTVDQFRNVFGRVTAADAIRDPLYFQNALPAERDEATQDALSRLRADAKLEEKEAFKNRSKRDAE